MFQDTNLPFTSTLLPLGYVSQHSIFVLSEWNEFVAISWLRDIYLFWLQELIQPFYVQVYYVNK